MVSLHDRDLLEVAHRIESGIAEETADLAIRSRHLELTEERIHRIRHVIAFRERFHLPMAIGELAGAFAIVDAYAGDGAEGDVGKAVFVAVEVGTLQQCGFGIDVPHLQIDADGRMQVAHDLFTDRMKLIHDGLLFIHFVMDVGRHVLVATTGDSQHDYVGGLEIHFRQGTQCVGTLQGRNDTLQAGQIEGSI